MVSDINILLLLFSIVTVVTSQLQFDSEEEFRNANCPYIGTCTCEMGPESHVLLPHRYSCKKYCQCIRGEAILKKCPMFLYFDADSHTCKCRKEAKCAAKDSTHPPEIPTQTPIINVTDTIIPSTERPTTEIPSLPEGNCSSIEKCPFPDSNNNTVLLPLESDCTNFCLCENGVPILKHCPEGYRFDRNSRACDISENVPCDGDVPYSTTPEGTLPDSTPSEGTVPDSTPSEGTIPDSTPSIGTTPDSSPSEGTIPDTTQNEGTVPDSTPSEATIPDSTPSEGTIPDTTQNEGTVPDSTSSVGTVPDSTPSEATIPDSTPSEGTIPDTTQNEGTVPDSTPSEATIPDSTPSEGTIPDTTQNEGTVPDSTPSEATIPDSTPSEGTIPDTTQNEGTVPESTSSVGTVPDSTPSEATIPDSTPSEGTIPDSSTSEGTVPDSTQTEGTVPDSTQTEGTVPDSTPSSDNDCIGKCPIPEDENKIKYLPHRSDCTKFCVCDNGVAIVVNCPYELHFSPSLEKCEMPWIAGCIVGEKNRL